jgi:E3 ubiquitin-protein ligase makorin
MASRLPRLGRPAQSRESDDSFRLQGWDHRVPAGAAAGSDSDDDDSNPPAPAPPRVVFEKSEPSGPEWRSLGHEKPPPKGASRTTSGTLAFQLPASKSSKPGGSWARVVGPVPQEPAAPEPSTDPVETAFDRPMAVPVCSYFVSGGCRAGERCRFRHPREALWMRDALGPSSEDSALGRAQALLAPGGPLDALEPLLNTVDPEVEPEEGAVPLLDTLQEQQDALLSASGLTEASLELAEREASASVECGICLEKPIDRQRLQASSSSGGWAGLSSGAEGAKFGLLTGCTHPFCLGCIRTWRARLDVPKETSRACPLCRAHSHFVVPCERMVTHPVRRAIVFERYKEHLSHIPCKLFDKGRGECPFGSSCFFEHRREDGTLEPMHPPSLYFDADGTVGGRKGLSLSDFVV